MIIIKVRQWGHEVMQISQLLPPSILKKTDLEPSPVISIIIPTYNEAENLKKLIPAICSHTDGHRYELVIVDDNSPDGTAEVAESMSRFYPVKVYKRNGKLGLASAILDGFRNSEGDILGVIDADFQHPPDLVINMVNKVANGYDIVIASRYVKGGKIRDWSLKRKLISRIAILLAKPLTPVKDPVSGYFMLKKDVLNGISFNPTGYKLLLEILVKGRYNRVAEVTYTFEKRNNGSSKLAAGEISRYLRLLLNLYRYKFFKKNAKSQKLSI